MHRLPFTAADLSSLPDFCDSAPISTGPEDKNYIHIKKIRSVFEKRFKSRFRNVDWSGVGICTEERAKRVKNSAFTLIELLIVIVLLGILAAVVIPAVGNHTEDSKVTATIANVQALQQAAVLAKLATGAWPPDEKARILPSDMEPFLPANAFAMPPPVGGMYDWQGSWGATAAVSIYNAQFPFELWTKIDVEIDDGDLLTGCVRLVNGSFLYFIVEE